MSDERIAAYCVKCKAERTVQDPQPVFLANGRPATRGLCPVCGANIVRIGRISAHADLPAPSPAEAPRARKARTTNTLQAGTALAPKGGTPKAPKAGTVAAQRGRTPSKPRLGKGKLVIVESPAKARTVGRYLGPDYEVRASIGHVRDLLRSKLSVDVENGFAPTYRVPDEKRDVVKALKAATANANQVYLATDPDREGEAIAWHLMEAVGIPADRAQRVVFHEITRDAIAEAFAHSRDIDMDLVDAQQARRILDRLVGYQVSPLLWDRVKSRLSAGRVQSVALRLIAEREREIAAFVPVEYWTIDAELAQQGTRADTPRSSFLARLVRIRGESADLKTRHDSQAIVDELEEASYFVSDLRLGERRRRPNPPFTTSTLQQEAAQRLGMGAARTMRVAQELYEGIDIGEGGGPVGLITYMRTDSVNVAREAQAEAREVIARLYGQEHLPAEPNVYRSRAKNAQEAHEAIRPTSCSRLPAALRHKLGRDQYRLYELIWQRFLASQMAAALYDTVVVEVEAGKRGESVRPYLFRASGSRVRFPGFLVVYPLGGEAPGFLEGPSNDEPGKSNGRNGGAAGGDFGGGANGEPLSSETENAATGEVLRALTAGEELDLLRLLPAQHFTQPPPRFTEASLVRTLEENGIGRPSTYAVIISTILDRGYVARVDRKLAPTELGFTVNDLLVKHFDSIFNVSFTATMEEQLDSIAGGQEEMVPVLRGFYDFFAPQVRRAEETMEKVVVEPEKTGEFCPEDGGELVVKSGRFGKFVGCSNYPACRFTKPLMTRLGVACPKDGGGIIERRTRRGRVFYGCDNYPDCDFVSWRRPVALRCPNCGGLMVMARKGVAECVQCRAQLRLEGPDS